jgi:hypothetical protein
MMCRFKMTCAALLMAGPVMAERQLTREQAVEILSKNAVCYVNSTGNCYSAEFFEMGGGTELFVTYTFVEANQTTIAREQVVWVGDNICVAKDANQITGFWTVDAPDRDFRFDLSNATPLDGAVADATYDLYASSRTEKYCYGYYSTSDGIDDLTAVILGNDVSSGTPVSLIPLWTGAVELVF